MVYDVILISRGGSFGNELFLLRVMSFIYIKMLGINELSFHSQHTLR
jgi:hypothetical protein